VTTSKKSKEEDGSCLTIKYAGFFNIIPPASCNYRWCAWWWT